MKLPPNGLSSGPANRAGAAQTDAAIVNVNRMYFMIIAPYEPVLDRNSSQNSRYDYYTINRTEGKSKSENDFSD